MIRLRLDRRLQGRIDSSDILQDAYLEVARRAPEYLAQPSVPPFLWLRLLTGQVLQALHRHHLKVQMRDASHEVSLRHRATPQANSASLAEMLLGRLTSPTRARGVPRCNSSSRRCSTPWSRWTARSWPCAISRS